MRIPDRENRHHQEAAELVDRSGDSQFAMFMASTTRSHRGRKPNSNFRALREGSAVNDGVIRKD